MYSYVTCYVSMYESKIIMILNILIFNIDSIRVQYFNGYSCHNEPYLFHVLNSTESPKFDHGKQCMASRHQGSGKVQPHPCDLAVQLGDPDMPLLGST